MRYQSLILTLLGLILCMSSAWSQLEEFPRISVDSGRAKLDVPTPGEALTPYQMDSLFESIMQEYHMPGLVALAIQGDSIVWKGEYGWADIEDSIPVTDSTGFILASISKTFVANAAMQLWEDGLLDLDANVNDYLPFDVVNPHYPDSIISTRMLLAHTSSLDRRDAIWMQYMVEGGDSPCLWIPSLRSTWSREEVCTANTTISIVHLEHTGDTPTGDSALSVWLLRNSPAQLLRTTVR